MDQRSPLRRYVVTLPGCLRLWGAAGRLRASNEMSFCQRVHGLILIVLIVVKMRLVSLSSSKRHNGSYLKSPLPTQKSQKNKIDEETFGGKKVWGTLLPPTLICNASSCIQPKPCSLQHVKVNRKLKSLKPLKFRKLRKSLKSQNMSNRCMMWFHLHTINYYAYIISI